MLRPRSPDPEGRPTPLHEELAGRAQGRPGAPAGAGVCKDAADDGAEDGAHAPAQGEDRHPSCLAARVARLSQDRLYGAAHTDTHSSFSCSTDGYVGESERRLVKEPLKSFSKSSNNIQGFIVMEVIHQPMSCTS